MLAVVLDSKEIARFTIRILGFRYRVLGSRETARLM